MRLMSRSRLLALLLLALFHISFGKSDPKLMLFDAKDIGNNTQEITITFIVPEKDFIYKDFITCSVYEPMLCLSPWKADKQSINHYDPSFKETKQVLNETFSITMVAKIKEWTPDPVHLYCSYYRKADKKINDALFTFSFPQPLQTNIQIYDTAIEPSQKINLNRIGAGYRIFQSIDACYFAFVTEIPHIIAFFRRQHKKIFSLLLILMSLLFLFFYFYQDALRKHKKSYEILEMITSLIVFTCTTRTLWYLYGMEKPISQLLATSITVLFLMIAGIFYIKKSTNVSLGFIRTFYTCIGILCIIGMVFLAFKTIQYADQEFNLFP